MKSYANESDEIEKLKKKELNSEIAKSKLYTLKNVNTIPAISNSNIDRVDWLINTDTIKKHGSKLKKHASDSILPK